MIRRFFPLLFLFALYFALTPGCACDDPTANGSGENGNGESTNGGNGGSDNGANGGNGGDTEPLPGYAGAPAPLDLTFRAGGILPNVTANHIVGDGDYLWAYGSGGDIGLVKLMDVSDPFNPVDLGQVQATPLPDYSGSDSYFYMAAQYPLVFIQSEEFFEGYDFSDPSAPVQIGPWPTGDVAYLHKSGSRLYAWGYGSQSRVFVFDVSAPATPTLLGSTPDINFYADRFFGHGNTLFMIDYGTLTAMDATDANNISEQGSFGPGGRIEDIDIEGNLAFLACRDVGLRIIDVTDPNAMVEIGSFMGGLSMLDADEISVDGNRAYLSVDSVIHALDVTDPTTPVELGAYTNDMNISDVFAQGNTALALDNWGLVAVDFTDPVVPVELVQNTVNNLNAHSMWVEGARLYAREDETLHVVDVTNPASASLLGSITLPLRFGTPAMSGNAVFAPLGLVGLESWDLSDVNAPMVTGGHEIPVGSAQMVFLGTNVFSGYFLDPAFGEGGLAAMDLSNPQTPDVIGHASGSGIHSMTEMEGNRIAVTRHNPEDYEGWLSIYDVSNPVTPMLVGQAAIDDSHIGDEIVAHGNRVFRINDYDFAVYDFSNPLNPTFDEPYGSNLEGNQALVDGQDLLVLHGDSSSSGVHLFDVDNLNTNVSLGAAFFEQSLTRMARKAPVVFAADSERVLHWRTLRRPSALRLVATLDTGPFASGFAHRDGLIALRASVSLKLIDMSQPDALTEVGSHDVPTGFYGVSLSENRAYLTVPTGIEILDIGDRTNPASLGTVEDDTLIGFALAANDEAVLAYSLNQQTPSKVMDLRDPANPITTELAHPGRAALLDGHIAYLAAEGIAVYDLSDPASPNELGFLSAEGPGGSALYFSILEKDGNRLYALDYLNRLHIFEDSAIPGTLPQPIGTFDLSSLGAIYPSALNARDGALYLHVSGGEGILSSSQSNRPALVILDAKEPSSIRLRGLLTHPDFSNYSALGTALSATNAVFLGSASLSMIPRADTPLRLSLAGGNPLFDQVVTYQASFDQLHEASDAFDVRCGVSGGTCDVMAVDQENRSATVQWTLPNSTGDFELAVMAGSYDGAGVGFAQVRKP
jgi:hypothetical protein